MAGTLSPPSSLDVKDIWFTNMLLLGFNPEKEEKKHKISFNKDMFKTSHKLGMEVVLHYLFTQLDPQQAYDEFRDCWPVHDKKQDQMFRKRCSNWVAAISKEEQSSGLPRIVAPLLLSPGGDKFYQLLLSLSTHCLQVACLKEAKPLKSSVFLPSSITDKRVPLLKDVHQKATMLHIARQSQLVVQCLEVLSHLHKAWKDYAHDLISKYREDLQKKHELEKIHQNLTSKSSVTTNIDKTKTRLLWKDLNNFLMETAGERECIHNFLTSPCKDLCIDGKDITSNLTSSNVINEEGGVNLIELFQTFTEELTQLKSYLEKNPLPELSEQIESCDKELQSHASHVTSAQQLRKTLRDHRDLLERRIASYEEELENLRGNISTSNDTLQVGRLIPPSPLVSHDLAVPSSLTPYHPFHPAPPSLDTPTAVQHITKSISKRSKMTSDQFTSSDIPSSKDIKSSPVAVNDGYSGTRLSYSNPHTVDATPTPHVSGITETTPICIASRSSPQETCTDNSIISLKEQIQFDESAGFTSRDLIGRTPSILRTPMKSSSLELDLLEDILPPTPFNHVRVNSDSSGDVSPAHHTSCDVPMADLIDL